MVQGQHQQLSGQQLQQWQMVQGQQQQLSHLQQQLSHAHQQMQGMWQQQQQQLNLWQHAKACGCVICLQGRQCTELKMQVQQLQ